MLFRTRRLASQILLLAAATTFSSQEIMAAPPSVPLAACAADLAPAPPAMSAAPVMNVINVPKPVGQVRHFDRPGITFSANTTVDGAIQLEARGGDLTFRKKVYHNGRFTVELQAPRDKVALGLTEHSITISRGRKTKTLEMAQATQDDLDDVRRMLADSKAVRLLRSAGADFAQDEDDDSMASAAFLLVDSLVGVLAGDVGAPGRVGRHLSRHARSRLRQVGGQDNCFYRWERDVFIAHDELMGCYRDVGYGSLLSHLCNIRWYIQVESYWFTFIACSGFSGF